MTEEKEEFLTLLDEELAAWDAMRQATAAMNALGLAQAEEYDAFHVRRRREMVALEAEVVAACVRYREARQAIARHYRGAVKGILVRRAKPYPRGERPD